MLRCLYLFILINFIFFASPYTYASRLALVIGNSDYQHESSLSNPVNDATDVATVLENLGFQVILKRNVNRRDMIKAVQDFGEQLPHYDVGLFYYSGHGLQAESRNFLVPVDAQIKSKADIEFESVAANRILHQMEEANNGVNIVILDACRDNPFKINQKGLRKGLARMDSPTGSLIAFATAPDTSAWGRTGERNSVYTKHLLNALQNYAHLSVTDLFTQVRKEVIQETQGENKQVPWESVSLTDRFCFGECDVYIDRSRKIQQSRLTYGRYTVNSCGSISDSRTGLEWYVGPDRNMTWDEARKWTQQLSTCGERWRMPNVKEIKTLYDPNNTAGTGYYTRGQYYPAHIHPVFDAIGSGSWIWANETMGEEARSFNLNQGIEVSYPRQNITYSTRAFAVR